MHMKTAGYNSRTKITTSLHTNDLGERTMLIIYVSSKNIYSGHITHCSNFLVYYKNTRGQFNDSHAVPPLARRE